MEITDVFGAQAGFTKSDFGFRKLFSKPPGRFTKFSGAGLLNPRAGLLNSGGWFTKSPGRFTKFPGAGLLNPRAGLVNFSGPVY